MHFEGRPLPGAFVALHPKGLADKKVLPAHAKTDAAGKFKASTYDANDGAIAGEYSVTVEYQELVKTDDGIVAGPNLLPPKYKMRRRPMSPFALPRATTSSPSSTSLANQH